MKGEEESPVASFSITVAGLVNMGGCVRWVIAQSDRVGQAVLLAKAGMRPLSPGIRWIPHWQAQSGRRTWCEPGVSWKGVVPTTVYVERGSCQKGTLGESRLKNL